jgi:NADH:ubiquinone oxidoreductase subunit 3 (subunit A)
VVLIYGGFGLLIIDGSKAFWIFSFIEFAFLVVAIIAARLVSPKKPNKIKNTIYECGQRPYGEARSFRILGITRYFGYGVIFFALDAFAWIILTSATSVAITIQTVTIIIIYTIVVFSGIAYFLMEKNKLV